MAPTVPQDTLVSLLRMARLGLHARDQILAFSTPKLLASYHRVGIAASLVIRQEFEREMIEKNDIHFMVGTVHKHPKNWIVVGLFYPPQQADLFD